MNKKRGTQYAFTLVELLATIAILAVLISVSVPIVGNYVRQARETGDKQTLTVLNDALTRYKTQGGDLSALTAGANIGRVLTLLQTPITWAGKGHQFLKSGTTYHPSSLRAMGNGHQYYFYGYDGYDSVSDSDIAAGTATSNMPYGKGVAYFQKNAGAPQDMTVESSTGYAACQIGNGAVTIVQADGGWGNLTGDAAATSFKVWSCAGAADSSFAGNITLIACYENFLTTLDVSGCASLQTLACQDNSITSLNVSNCSVLGDLYCSNNSISSLDISDCTSLLNIFVENNNLSGLDVSSNTALDWLMCHNNNISSLDLTGLTNLTYISYYANPLTTSSSALNAFYNTLEPPSGGSGNLWENEVDDQSPVDVGQDTGLIPAGWVFWSS